MRQVSGLTGGYSLTSHAQYVSAKPARARSLAQPLTCSNLVMMGAITHSSIFFKQCDLVLSTIAVNHASFTLCRNNNSMCLPK